MSVSAGRGRERCQVREWNLKLCFLYISLPHTQPAHQAWARLLLVTSANPEQRIIQVTLFSTEPVVSNMSFCVTGDHVNTDSFHHGLCEYLRCLLQRIRLSMRPFGECRDALLSMALYNSLSCHYHSLHNIEDFPMLWYKPCMKMFGKMKSFHICLRELNYR